MENNNCFTIETMASAYIKDISHPTTVHLYRGTRGSAPQEQTIGDPDVSFTLTSGYASVINPELLTAPVVAWQVNPDGSLSVAVAVWRPEPDDNIELPF